MSISSPDDALPLNGFFMSVEQKMLNMSTIRESLLPLRPGSPEMSSSSSNNLIFLTSRFPYRYWETPGKGSPTTKKRRGFYRGCGNGYNCSCRRASGWFPLFCIFFYKRMIAQQPEALNEQRTSDIEHRG